MQPESDFEVFRYREKERVVCILVWPDGPPTVSEMDFMYVEARLVLVSPKTFKMAAKVIDSKGP